MIAQVRPVNRKYMLIIPRVQWNYLEQEVDKGNSEGNYLVTFPGLMLGCLCSHFFPDKCFRRYLYGSAEKLFLNINNLHFVDYPRLPGQ